MPEKEYIERVSLIKFAMNYIPNIHGDTTMKAVKRALKAAPAAADVVEVVHGEWELNTDGSHWCSECGHDATYTYDGTEVCGVSCPFCGARMDSERKEQT